MLVLSRKPQEKIRIGDSIVVTVLALKGNSVRLGIEAPQDVRIVRAELTPLSDAAEAKSTESKATAVSVAAPIEVAEEAEEIAGFTRPGRLPAVTQRTTDVPTAFTQCTAHPR